MKNFSFVVLLMMGSLAASAQRNPEAQQKPTIPTKAQILKDGEITDAFRKKFRYGVSMNIYLNKITGTDLPEQYFWKPGLGGLIRAQYNFKEWIGVSAGIGFQQSGAGIINQDISGGAFSHPWIVNKFGVRGDPDSTYLEKLRFSNIDVPVMLELRTKKGVIQPDWRLSGGIGLNFMRTQRVNKIWQSVVDGFHDDHFVTQNYITNDVGLMGAVGFDVDSGTGQMFQARFVVMKGFGNVYKVGPGDGHQSYLGLQFSYFY